jgi:putative DNA primase/helicase
MELPGIRNWALAGWQRLAARGHFVMPKASDAIAQRNADLTSPIRAFVRQRCVVDHNGAVERAVLFERWCAFCPDEGMRPPSSAVFGKMLIAAIPSIDEFKPFKQQRQYTGIKLADPSELDDKE